MKNYFEIGLIGVALLLLAACDQKAPSAPLITSEKLEKPEILQQEAIENTEPVAMAKSTEGYPSRVFWGDTHVHTSKSFDVYLFGTPGSTADTTYRFAKGLPVINPTTGTRWQMRDALDFLVIADHAEMFGSVLGVFEGDEQLIKTKTGKAMLRLAPDQSEEQLQAIYDAFLYAASNTKNELGVMAKDLVVDLHIGDTRKPAWSRNIEAAELHNEPGIFTTLIGFEWSSNQDGKNLHRIVFQAEGGDVANQYIPYSFFESADPEDLWKWLEITSKNTGASFVAIPHNSNISIGRMFPLNRNNGKPVDAEYAKLRAKWEPVVEATQIKGDSEAHPALSPNDEFADYEIYDYAHTPDGTRPDPTNADYIRTSLMQGLEFKKKLGTNPYKLGMIGATDSHVGLSAAEENNFAGKGQHDSKPELRSKPTGLGSSMGWDMGAAGYAGVWARENTREALYDAFKRKEVYSTTGPRMTLRFFGGFNYEKADLTSAQLAKNGYAKGVPMGGDLKRSDKAPNFLISVLKDPKGANLDRIQIIKGWLDKQGELHERIYDVAVSGERIIGENGRSKEAVGNTVNLKTGGYTNTIGESQLSAYWSDPEFDADEEAFYYVRGLEIPTPRYSLLDSIALGIDWKTTNRPATIQERVYSSPIWYTP